MKRILFTALLCAAVSISANAIPGNRQRAVESVIASSSAAKGAVISVMAMSESGDTLVNIDCDRLLLPASNMKLVTTGAALHYFGSDWRYSTRLAVRGTISDGVLEGDVCIIGCGDPTLGSLDSIGPSADNIFKQWKSFLDKCGIREIRGGIIGDASVFGGIMEHPSWCWEDLGSDYGQGCSGLNFCENQLRFSVSPSATSGAKVILKQGYPQTPWLNVENLAVTSPAGSGSDLTFYTAEFSSSAILQGSYGLDSKPRTLICSNKHPALTCANEFKKYLGNSGIKVCGDAGEVTALSANKSASSRRDIGASKSSTLARIARFTNVDSNNLYAESLMRTIGLDMTGSASYDSSAVAVTRVLASMGIGPEGIHITDGSGLSRKNYVSPSFFCRYLAAMQCSPSWEAFRSSLPRPAMEGTLKNAFKRLPEDIRPRILMKSGSMNGVRCYSGYYFPTSGETIIFSVMVNNCTASTAQLRRLTEDIISAIVL